LKAILFPTTYLKQDVFLKRFRHLLIALAGPYLLACGALYFLQKSMLFPAYVTQPVPADWQPNAGDSASQAFINGNCGKLHVAYWKIKNAKGTLMMSHGNGESLASINDYAYAFHALGYNLMTWDYPGYGQSTDCWFSQADLLDDAESAYQWLAKQEKPEKIFIFGYSIGTGIALSVAAKHQQNPIFLVAAYDSLLNVAKDNFNGFVPVSLLMRYPLHTKQLVAAIKQPIYVIHGTKDKLISPARAQGLVTESQHKVNIEWVKSAGHTDDALFIYRNNWLKKLLP
jgi:uncharacterized protein